MPYDTYQASIAKLDEYHAYAREYRNEPDFYKYLFQYFETLSNDAGLLQAALKFWLSNALDKYKNDEKVIMEVFEPLFEGSDKTLNTKQKIHKLETGQLKYDKFQMVRVILRLNEKLANERHKEVDPSYCFQTLFFNHYALRKAKPEEAKKIIDFITFNSEEAKDFLRNDLSEDEAAEVKTIINDAGLQAKLTEFIPANVYITPAELSFLGLTQSDYVSSLNFFHTEFSDWLPKYVSGSAASANNMSGTKELTKVRLSFQDQYPLVIEVETNKEYPFSKRIVQSGEPYRIYQYCLEAGKSQDGEQRFIYFAKIIDKLTKDISNRTDGKTKRNPRGVAETLRRSIFSASEALGPFVELEESRGRVKARELTHIDDSQLQKIIEATEARDHISSE